MREPAPAGTIRDRVRLFFDLFKLRIGFAIGLTALAGAVAVPGGGATAWQVAILVACVIAASFARNALRTVQIAEAAKERGARLIVFSDSPLAPISQLADALLLIRTESPSFIQSLTAVFSVVNGLVLTTSAQRGEEVTSRLAEIEELLRRFDVVLFAVVQNQLAKPQTS